MKKTSITLEIEKIDERINETERRFDTAKRLQNANRMNTLNHVLIELISIKQDLEEARDTTEREQMISMAENAYWDIIGGGVINTTDQEQVRKDAENLFNGTYGNGE